MMNNELVPVFSTSWTPVLTSPPQQVSSPLYAIAGVMNTSALLSEIGPDGTEGMGKMPLIPDTPHLSTPSGSYASSLSVQTLPAPDFSVHYDPLLSLAGIADTLAPVAGPSHDRHFASHAALTPSLSVWSPSSAASPMSAGGLAQNMLAAIADQHILRERCNSLLQASLCLRRKLSGNRKTRFDSVPADYRKVLKNIAAVYEALNGWGLLPINRNDIIELIPNSAPHQENLHRLRQKISEHVMEKILQGQFSSSSPAQRQQQQFAESVHEVYQNEKLRALQKLNIATPLAVGRRLNISSTRALDAREPTEATPDIALDVQCGEQVALTYALLLRLPKNAVSVEQLCMVTFSAADGHHNHSVLLYGWSSPCPLRELIASRSDPRERIAPEAFLTWCFTHRQGVVILDPWGLDKRTENQSESVPHNALKTNKCLDFSVCPSIHALREAIHALIAQAGILPEAMVITVDHPLTELYESALGFSSDDTSSIPYIDDIDDRFEVADDTDPESEFPPAS